MKRSTLTLIFLPVIVLACTALFWGGDYAAYILVYVFSFVFLFFFAGFSSSTIWQKSIQIVIYALIMVAQILINTYLIRPSEDNATIYYFCRLLGVIIIFIPFVVERLFFYRRMDGFANAQLGDDIAIPYAMLLYDQDALVANLERVKKAGKVLSKVRLEEITQDLPRHSSFSYVNNGSLTPEYFDKAYSTLEDKYIYLVVTKTKTTPSEVIGLFTGKQYNHISISFDRDLNTALSYNGGQKITPPGLNHELLEQLSHNNGSSVMVYQLPASDEQKRDIIEKVRQINDEGSAYNLMGLVLKFSWRPNIMFCSQFVYSMLQSVNLHYFDKNAGNVKPSDFVEMDYYRKLEFVYEISLYGANSGNGVKTYGPKTP